MLHCVTRASPFIFILAASVLCSLPAVAADSNVQSYSNPTARGYPIGTTYPSSGSSPADTARRFCQDRGHQSAYSFNTAVRSATYTYLNDMNGMGGWAGPTTGSATMFDSVVCQGSGATFNYPTVNGLPVGTLHPAPGTSSPSDTARRYCLDRGHTNMLGFVLGVRSGAYSYLVGTGGTGSWSQTASYNATYLDSITCTAPTSPPPEPPFQQTVLDQGTGWQLVNIQGNAVDDSGGAYNANMYVLRNADGIQNAPMSADLKQDLNDDVSGEDTVILVDQKIVNEIAISEQQGYLTPYLQSIAEPGENTAVRGQKGMFGKCSNKAVSKVKTWSLNNSLSDSGSLGAGFEGSLTTSGAIQASATGEVHLENKRYALFWVCVPYGVKFNNARAHGSMTIGSNFSLSGTIKYTHSWEKELLKLKLFSLNFFIGPIPVHIGFNMPLTVGLDLQASVTGTVNYNSGQSASGSFDYTCTLDTCTGGASFTSQDTQPNSPVTAGISGRIEPSLWLEAGIRAYLYDEWVAYAQVGIRPYLRADFWGYYGNACGDGDGDGVNETVSALTLDLDWQLYVTGRAAIFGGAPKKWNDIWHLNRRHIKFWDLTTSSAIRPLLSGPATAQTHVLQNYDVKMRPCWPYGDNVSYRVDWGDGDSTSLSGAPQAGQITSHAWSTNGQKEVSLTPLSDAHGRAFPSRPSARAILVSGTSTPPPSGSHSFDYAASNTNYASQNTVNRTLVLTAGQTLTVGTCGVDGASGTGDTYLRLAGPGGAVVALNDDACNLLSRIVYTVPPGGTGSYTIMAGCFASGSCSGRVVWTVGGSFYYSATNTNSATTATANFGVLLTEGETISVGTCNVPGSAGTNDTFLRLNNAVGTEVYFNDDNCGGRLSYLTYAVPPGGSGQYLIRAGCYWTTSCDGTVAYLISGP
jgi:hypothetical protein